MAHCIQLKEKLLLINGNKYIQYTKINVGYFIQNGAQSSRGISPSP